MTKQTFSRSDLSNTRSDKDMTAAGRYTFKCHQENKTPSWKVYGNGSAEAYVSTHRDRHFLELNVLEFSFPHDPKKERIVTRQTFMTLEPEAAQALFDMMVAAGFKTSEGELEQ
jgi:hypothetical protein